MVSANSKYSMGQCVTSSRCNASIEDVAKFLQALIGVYQDFLSVEDIKKFIRFIVKLLKKQINLKKWQPNLKKSFHGLGCRIYDYAGHTIVDHGGMA